MGDTPLIKKLGIKPGFRCAIINAPAGYLDVLGALPEGATFTTSGGPFDLVQLFVYDKADVDAKATDAIANVKPGGLLWFCYPKKTGKIKTDISRDDGWQSVYDRGWEPVTLVSIDDTWSAFRFRPIAEIKSPTRSAQRSAS